MALPRLVATDLDGTLLRPDRTVSAWTRQVLDRVRAAGVRVVPATARQLHLERNPRPGKLHTPGRGITDQAGFDDWAVCSNGALVLHLGTGEVLREANLAPADQQAVVTTLRAAEPEAEFVTVAETGYLFRTSRGYPPLATATDHMMIPEQMTTVDLDELVDRPALKLMARHPRLGPAALAELLVGIPGVEVTSSGAPFLEISAGGVTKAAGVAALVDHLGLTMADVVAYGDADNDISLLAAAGRGVAMPGAEITVRDVADEVAPGGHEQDGMARHLVEVLGIDLDRPTVPTAG